MMTLFLMPTVYAVLNRRSDERAARAEARREGIALGENNRARQKARGQIAASGAAIVGETVIHDLEDAQ
jgi:HAE1 family hydrophobic/amphiphilic exporter-1